FEQKNLEFQQATDTTNLKLQFLQESFTAITQTDIDAVKNGSEMWGLLEKNVFQHTETLRERRIYFESNRAEIQKYAKENNLNTIDLNTAYTGTYNQNIIFKSYLKHVLFDNEEKMKSVNNSIIFEETNAPKNRFDRAVNENYNFDYTQTDAIQNNIDNNLDTRTQEALDRLSENITKKGIRVKKNAIMIVSDISNKKIIISQNGKIIDEISPIVFSKKGIGNKAGSQKTPTGSFIIKGRGKRALHRENNVTGYFLHMAGIENSNSNAYARGIGIHGMPTNDAGIANDGTTTHGCIGMTNENIQKLYNLMRGKQTFVETIK
ncbi:TPA: L,D-transpeptidase family protein, partial [Candidatus Gracilibacteria bacterium]|nr:L,D-transpeptidase family protein [Candidatus Gracilibacteria bacterium]